jgi:hypothetical protein
VAGTAAAEGKPSAMFAAHAAAITEVWLALSEHGPAHGIQLEEWLTDRAGWQEWEAGTYWSRRYRLTPDAVAQVRMPGGSPAVAFIEVDLASMTQTLLKEKVARYLAYAADRTWQGIHPYCPPLLLLTTTATRAATFVRAAGQLIDQYERTLPFDDPADVLVVAACGHVHDPARVVIEACWKVPEAAAAELTLSELLSERLEAQAESEDWHARHDAAARRRADLDVMQDLRSFAGLADWLDSEHAAEAVRAVVGTDPTVFLDTEPGLAEQIIEWGRNRRRMHRSEAREHARPLVHILEKRHVALWARQAQLLLFLRSLTGLDREAANDAFGQFLAGKTFNANQLHFLNLLVDVLAKNGIVDIARLYEPPFTARASGGPEDLFTETDVDAIVTVLRDVKATAVPISGAA